MRKESGMLTVKMCLERGNQPLFIPTFTQNACRRRTKALF